MTVLSKIFNPQSKVLYHLDTVLDYFDGKNVDPITMEIDPSNACNHSCPFCISGHIHLSKFKGTEFFNRQMMDKKTLLNLVQDLSKTKIKSIAFTGGGEPTMNPSLKDAIVYLKKNSNIQLGMYSNGSMMKRFDLFDTIVESLEWIRVSIDAGTKKSYDDLRVTNSSNNFDVVISNIKKLIERKKELKSNIIIGVGFVVTQDNYNEVIDFANLFKDIDVDYCQFKPEIIQIERNGTQDDKKQQISSEFWAYKIIDLLNEASQILGKKFESNAYKIEDLIVDQDNYGRGYKECIGSQFQPCIGADGHVYVCTNHRGHKKYSYGNLYEESFKKIWGNIKKKQKIMNLINKKEKFCNCTQLCKPHESNKMLWSIKNNLKNKEAIKDLKKKSKEIGSSLVHKNFI
ncbi:radical SAM protein [Candidatus Pelagibacter sp.]|nr:radical SAM protein [Candidatus Pelagibacter sp.]